MPISTLARPDVITADIDAPVADLARLMRDRSVGSVVIMNADTPEGIVTDRDLTTRILAEGLAPDDLTARDVMSSDLCSVGPEAGFYEAAEAMAEHGVRRLPVCDDGDNLVGIVTADDLTELLAEEHQLLATVIESQRPAY